MESVENSKGEFPTLSTALGNPAKSAGFPHFHSAYGGCSPDTTFKILPIGVVAYNLSQVLKANLLPPEYRQVSAATLRWKLYRVPGKLVRHARAWVLKVRTEGEKLALLEAARHRCNELSVSSA